MKRLFVMMCLAVMTATAFAQSKDFGGTWVLDVEKSGTKEAPPGMTITMTPKIFSVQFDGAGRGQAPLTFNLDGTETTLERGAKGKVAWKGNKLEVTIVTPNGPQSITFAREGAWLMQEGISPRGPMKIYFKKAPAKS